jgi:hypothetical protein
MQAAKFPHVHLEAGGWYLDCSRGFVPDEEESLYSSLVSSAPDVIELEKEPDMPAPQSIEKDVAPVKVRARIGSLSLMHLLKFLLVLTVRLSFNTLLLQLPLWLEVLLPLPLPLPRILFPLLLIATLPSHPCLGRRRQLHQIHRQLPLRGHLAFP